MAKLIATYNNRLGNEVLQIYQTGIDSFRYIGKAGAGCGSLASLRSSLSATLPKLTLKSGTAI
jgi:hypothetical protein